MCYVVQGEAGDGGGKKGQLITTEDQETGQIGTRVYWMYMKVRSTRSYCLACLKEDALIS